MKLTIFTEDFLRVSVVCFLWFSHHCLLLSDKFFLSINFHNQEKIIPNFMIFGTILEYFLFLLHVYDAK